MLSTTPQSYHKDGFLYDIINGSLFKSHPLFSVKPSASALQIILYTDEIEICNPLGLHASVNKLLMVYYTLGNIDPKFRSKLAAIRLLAIAKADDIDKCGVDFVLQRIDEDLKLLYGVTIETNSGGMDLFGAVVSVCGETLAQHELAGFKEGVGFAYSKCRHCECTFEEMQIHFNEESFTKRTIEKHIQQCREIEKASADFLKSALKTTYGINRRSKMVDFPAFDLIRQTPHDVMHIILEGVALMEIKCVLKYPVLSGQKELDVFNSAMHLKQFKQLFPENNVIPKQHYLLHLPAQILSLCSLIRHMCMRFESKHCFFKQWASKLNFKNVCKSLVKHNQLYECCQNEVAMEHPLFFT